jgi:hypothetical protein
MSRISVEAICAAGGDDAVPVLIELLRSSPWRESMTAEYGLEALAHRRGASTELAEPPPSDTYLKWIRW